MASVESKICRESFGFTEEEVKRILDKRKVKIEIAGKLVTEVNELWEGPRGVKEWYNGYHIGSVAIVNPYSFVSFLYEMQLKSYWLKGFNSETLFDVLEEHALPLREFVLYLETILECIFSMKDTQPPTDVTPVNSDSGRIWIPVFVSTVNIRDSKDWCGHHALCYLVMIGYLAFISSEGDAGYVWIPNGEIRQAWEDIVRTLYNRSRLEAVVEFYSGFIGALVNHKLHHIQRLFRETIHDLSIRVRWEEYVYQFMIFGLSLALRRAKKSSTLRVMKGAGNCVCDLIFVFEEEKTVCVFGMNMAKSEKCLNAAAITGFRRIIKKQYWEDINDDYQILLVSVAVYKDAVSQIVADTIGRGQLREIDERRMVQGYEEGIKPKRRRTVCKKVHPMTCDLSL